MLLGRHCHCFKIIFCLRLQDTLLIETSNFSENLYLLIKLCALCQSSALKIKSIWILLNIHTCLTNYLASWSRVLQKLNSSSASQKIIHILWNPKVHYRIHNCQHLINYISQCTGDCVLNGQFCEAFMSQICFLCVKLYFHSTQYHIKKN